MPSVRVKKSNLHAKRPLKYKLLLDESLPPPTNFPKLNNFHDIQHIAQDYNLSGISDSKVYAIANAQHRMVVVFNTKDFKPLIQPHKSSVIALSTNLLSKEADLKLVKALKEITPQHVNGCLISITKSGVTIKVTVK